MTSVSSPAHISVFEMAWGWGTPAYRDHAAEGLAVHLLELILDEI